MAISPTPVEKPVIFIEKSLYEVHNKVYPRSVSGVYANARWLMVWFTQLLFYGLCWLPWHGRQAVLFDLVARKFYVFGLVFWPQDVIYLAVLLIISAYSLFLFTAVGGRLWCGYACPQTVYTEIFLWIERKIEGDRAARMKLDSAAMSSRKILLRLAKYVAWGLLALWTGFTFVGYFTPIKTLAASVFSFSLGPWETFWIIFYGTFTYIFAGHLREQVCKYMCPYARFQGVMFDPDTLTITYDAKRGEPRGGHKKGDDYKAQGKGDCVDCGICVQVCPTGIDIRKGLQYECIGCAACIDACDQVMEKMSTPKGLIRYSTEHAIASQWGWREIIGHVIRPRVLIYAVVLWVIIFAFIWGIATKPALKVDVIRDRAVLAREVDNGMIENVYRLHLMNVSEHAQQYELTVRGLPGLTMLSPPVFDLPTEADRTVLVQVQAPPESGKKGAHEIYFDFKDVSGHEPIISEEAKFFLP